MGEPGEDMHFEGESASPRAPVRSPEDQETSTEQRVKKLEAGQASAGRRSGWALGISLATVLIAFLGSVFFPYLRVHHGLEATVYGFNVSPDGNTISVDVIFRNTGNRRETMLRSYFMLPCDSKGRTEIWPGGNRIALPTVVLEPGETAHRTLIQSFPGRDFLAPLTVNRHAYDNPDVQIIWLAIQYVDPKGFPLSKRIHIADAGRFTHNQYPYVTYGNEGIPGAKDEDRCRYFMRVNLLEGGDEVVESQSRIESTTGIE